MPIVWLVVAIAVSLIAGLVGGMLMGKQTSPATQDKTFEVPTSEIGVPIPILFGTRLIQSPSIAWYGDLRIIKVKVDTKGKK